MKLNAKILSRVLIPVCAVMLTAAAVFGSYNTFTERLNAFLNGLMGHVNTLNSTLPEDRVYVQTDKPFYVPGDDIWFSAWVRDGASLKPSSQSDIVNVELINPKGTVEKSIRIVAKNGVAAGDFLLDAEAPGGMYKLKAWTQWQQNEPMALLFEKEFQVQKVVLPNLKMKLEFERKAYGAGDEVTALLDLQTNENKPLSLKDFRFAASLAGQAILAQAGKTDASGTARVKFRLPASLNSSDGLLNVMIDYNGLTESVSRSIPITLNKIDLGLFPEGGDLVTGLRSRVAFRARNEFGKPADVEGVVRDSKGSTLTAFTSFHDGMGAFDLTPRAGETYTVHITKPEGISQAYTLPEALPAGYVLRVDAAQPGQLTVNVQAPDTDMLNLVAQVRSQVYWKSEVDVKPGNNIITIPTRDFPIGVAQITLFDRHGIERAERLAFVNREKQLRVSVEANKDKYLPREKVQMTLKVTDERGMPMPASLCVSVVNDQLLSFADYKGGNMMSQLLLEQDLKEKVHEPAWYFDPAKADAALGMDYLLMTSGWRRFEWKTVLAGTPPLIRYPGEKAVIAGQVINGMTGQPIPYASVTFPRTGMGIMADAQGQYSVRGIDLGLEKEIQISARDLESQNYPISYYGPNQNIWLYPKGWQPLMVDIEPNAMDFDMAEEAPMMLDEVMIVEPQRAVKRDAPVPMAAPRAAGGTRAAAPGRGEAEGAARVPVGVVNAVPAQPMAMDGNERERVQKEKEHDNKNQQEIAGKPQDGVFVMGQKVVDSRIRDDEDGDAFAQNAAPVYYRARVFPVPAYKAGEAPANGVRTDFRNTLYWNPHVEVDRSGKAVVEFVTSDEISSFRAVAEGIGITGAPGRAEKVFFTQLPFSLQARVPTETATGDLVAIPLTLRNNTDRTLTGKLSIKAPEGMQAAATLPGTVTLQAGQTLSLPLSYKVLHKPGDQQFEIGFEAQGLQDAFVQAIHIEPRGFPVQLSLAGKETEKTFRFRSEKLVEGSMSLHFTAYPNVISDLMKGIEAILREPYGCFEQTSTSTYPNTLVLRYLQQQENPDPAIATRARDLLDKGYKRLTTFETKNKGYEWFGSNPPHEALTAYGIMQFQDMKRVGGEVDKGMLDRTLEWMLSRRDGKGGFKRDPKQLDSFGGASPEITNAYIVYALTDAGITDIRPEIDAAYADAIRSEDPYRLALLANALYAVKDKARAEKCMEILLRKQAQDGSFTGTSHSITRSGGISLTQETSSLAIMALVKQGGAQAVSMQNAVKYLMGSRSGYGGFANTQATIMALKALTDYAEFSKQTREAGDIEIWVDGKKVASHHYDAGERNAIEIKGLEQYAATEGEHEVKVKFVGVKDALPWSVNASYHSYLPQSQAECVADLQVNLAATTLRMGETVRMSAVLTNRTQEGQPMTMAILGIPAGLSAQPWQLKEMQEKGVFDFYEVVGNNLVCYYRQMKPGEVRNINLDLKADIPGEFDAPASRAYLYYTAEYKTWTALPRVKVTP